MAGAGAAISAAAPELAAAALPHAPVAPPVVAPSVVAPPVVAAPTMPVPAAPVVAAPVVAAPVVAAPVVAAPVVSNAPSGKKGKDGEGKGKFRETMWFKKGELDAQAAQAAADERAKTGKDVSADKADSMPIDERYKDDGSITRGDKEKYSLRTGATQMMSSVKDPSEAGASMAKVSEDALIGEMKGGRTWIVFAIIGALLAVIAIVYFAAS